MSTLKTNTLSNVAGSKSVPVGTVVDGSAKAWVNFNGAGTVAIRRAFNVSSITDNGVGNYLVNFATAMVDGDYVVAGSAATDSAVSNIPSAFMTNNQLAAYINVLIRDNTAASVDRSIVSVAIFR